MKTENIHYNILITYIDKAEFDKVFEKIDYLSEKNEIIITNKPMYSELKGSFITEDYNSFRYPQKLKTFINGYIEYINTKEALIEELFVSAGKKFLVEIFLKERDYMVVRYLGLEGIVHKNSLLNQDTSIFEDYLIGDEVEMELISASSDRKLRFALPQVRTSITASNIAEAKISSVAKHGLTSLDLSNLGIESITKEIKRCENLEIIDVSNNNLVVIPRELFYLSNLKSINFNNNNIRKIPEEISNLEKLEYANFGNNNIKTFPLSIVDFDPRTFKDIILENNPISELYHLDNTYKLLRKVIVDGFFEAGNVISLKDFQVGQVLTANIKLIYGFGLFVRYTNQHKEYREGLLHKSQMKNYDKVLRKHFKIGDPIEVKIIEIKQEEEARIKMPTGGLSFTITEQIEAKVYEKALNIILNTKSNLLKRLDLSNFNLKELPIEVCNLEHLVEIDLRGNFIQKLPNNLSKLINLKSLLLDNIPIEIQNSSPQKIISYFNFNNDIQNIEEKKDLREGKMLIVGQGGVGKTSLLKRILYDRFSEDEKTTDGLDIKKWKTKLNNEEVYVNIWDFGGQEIYHSTHQFFLTKRSVYILVWDSRQEDEHGRIDYWLKLIQSFGKNSPIIVVSNRIDEAGGKEIDKDILQQKYNIRHFVETSCKTGKGIKELRKKILESLVNLEHLKIPWKKSWFNIKTDLENINANFCDYSEYENICKKYALINEEEQIILIEFLHDLGVVLNFQDNSKLKHTNILQPEWVTKAVYSIINATVIRENGAILNLEMLKNILDRNNYPQEKHFVITNIMQRFELSYEMDNNDGSFLIPELLSIKRPKYDLEYDKSLKFRYNYNFLPDSIISRFIVRMHRLIHKLKVVNHQNNMTISKIENLVWKNGVILKKEGNQALIFSDRDKNNIYIYVTGQKNTRRELLAEIRGNFEHIHSTISKIQPTGQIPLYDTKDKEDIVVAYEHLVGLEGVGEEYYRAEKTLDKFSIKELLQGID